MNCYYQGSRVDDQGYFPNLKAQLTRRQQRRQIDLIQAMNRDFAAHSDARSEVEVIIESYELAFRMQDRVPELLDITSEPQSMLDA